MGRAGGGGPGTHVEALEERQLVVDVEDGVPAVDDVEGALLKGALGSVSHLKGHLEGRGQLGLVVAQEVERVDW